MWFPLACRQTSHPTNMLFIAHQCCADEIKNTVFLSDLLYCKDCYCKLSDLVNEEATIACLLFCHQRPSINCTQNCLWLELNDCFSGKRSVLSCNWTGCQNMVSECVLHIDVNLGLTHAFYPT